MTKDDSVIGLPEAGIGNRTKDVKACQKLEQEKLLLVEDERKERRKG